MASLPPSLRSLASRMRLAASGTLRAARRMLREQFVRRAALALELTDRYILRRSDPILVPSGPGAAEGCILLAVVAHWRGAAEPEGSAAPEPLLLSIEGLLTMHLRRLEIVVVTNDADATTALLLGHFGHDRDVEIVRGAWTRPSDAAVSIRVEGWRPRWPRDHGFFLTWHHKEIFRRAIDAGDFTHLLYLEDDMRLTRENLDYWLAARRALAPSGFLPAFVRFEQVDDRKALVDQVRSGQHGGSDSLATFEGIGEVSVRVTRRPYQACYLVDRELAVNHLNASPFRAPFRSNVARWDLRERAAAGPTLGPTPAPLRAFLRPKGAQLSIRSAVLATRSSESTYLPVAGALIEHLRPTYSRDPSSRHGKLSVDEF